MEQEGEESISDELEPEDGLIGVKSITIQLDWTDPLYVSSLKEERNALLVKVLPKMFENDQGVELSEEEVQVFKFEN